MAPKPLTYQRLASPHTRGWTCEWFGLRRPGDGFPAHAGMDPRPLQSARTRRRLPRTRGDGPNRPHTRPSVRPASPHTRGWTPAFVRCRHSWRGFPAHAGMDPAPGRQCRAGGGLPRTRGDGPGLIRLIEPDDKASPHTRGWTVGLRQQQAVAVGFPAHAGMDPPRPRASRSPSRLPRTRGDGPTNPTRTKAGEVASPHTRGWTRGVGGQPGGHGGFPAHAGMDPVPPPPLPARPRLPRTRGDGPRAPLIRLARYPASPHTRGWTHQPPAGHPRHRGFPAHAGMDRGLPRDAQLHVGLPRTRGDGPWNCPTSAAAMTASPHTRGWTLVVGSPQLGLRGFPAHAGMDRSPRPMRDALVRLPRTRGDGPWPTGSWSTLGSASPHTRGWTPRREECISR